MSKKQIDDNQLNTKEEEIAVDTNDLFVVPITVEDEMQKSYLAYAMSVIVGRALPDFRDGLKPVHRRILHAMHDSGNYHNTPYRKSARVVGEVMGKYHPHGDSPIYSSLTRMTQSFSQRIALLDGQGNFGSVDGDEPAHMRYTEVRLAEITEQGLMQDLDKDTVDFQDNYDGSETEPVVLPARFPHLLLNGSNGIAVGMATNIPTHNMGELIEACCEYLANESITPEELLEYMPAPDFPTGGEIINYESTRKAMLTGRGSVMVRGKSYIETTPKKAIIITEIPYQVNKSDMVKTIEQLVNKKVIEGITDIRDESNKLGMRVVIELRRDMDENIVLNRLHRHTQLESSFSVNMLALKGGLPVIMNVHSVIAHFLKFREDTVTRRTRFLLQKARNRAHVLIGLCIAVENIGEIIATVKNAADQQTARHDLSAKSWQVTESVLAYIDSLGLWNENDNGNVVLSEEQLKAILDMRLQRITGLERGKIQDELQTLSIAIKDYNDILQNRPRLLKIIESELQQLKQKFATPRSTIISDKIGNADDDSLIQEEEIVVVLTKDGYIKRTSLGMYREQKRGGRGKNTISMSEDDIIHQVLVTTTHRKILFFSNHGKVYQLKAHKLPQSSTQSKGRAVVNILPVIEGEKITKVLALDPTMDENSTYIVFATAMGNARRNAISSFKNIQANGKIAFPLDTEDELVGIVVCSEGEHVMLATRFGKAVRFRIDELRVFKSRMSDGVKAVKLKDKGDRVVSLSVLDGIEVVQEEREAYLRLPLQQRLSNSAKIRSVELENANQSSAGILKAIDDIDIPGSLKEKIELLKHEQFILTITSNGYGKLTSAYEYRWTGRNGQGVMNMDVTRKNGFVVCSFPVQYEDSIMISTGNGMIIRVQVRDIRVTKRGSIGVKVIELQESDTVSSVSKIEQLD